MFTGIISDVTAVKDAKSTDEGLKMTFERPVSWHDLELGESISTNGVCLTVAAMREDEYDCVLVPETLSKTAFGEQVPPAVNVERAMLLSDRLGGHFVQGHVDGVGKVEVIDKAGEWRLTIGFDLANRALIVPKGSITVNGVSLTVAALTDDSFEVALVPYTLEHTTLNMLTIDDIVNLEFDMIGKYVVKLMESK